MRREEALGRLRAEAGAGRAVIGAGAGTGLSAKCAEAGGGDIIYNSGEILTPEKTGIRRLRGHEDLARRSRTLSRRLP